MRAIYKELDMLYELINQRRELSTWSVSDLIYQMNTLISDSNFDTKILDIDRWVRRELSILVKENKISNLLNGVYSNNKNILKNLKDIEEKIKIGEFYSFFKFHYPQRSYFKSFFNIWDEISFFKEWKIVWNEEVLLKNFYKNIDNDFEMRNKYLLNDFKKILTKIFLKYDIKITEYSQYRRIDKIEDLKMASVLEFFSQPEYMLTKNQYLKLFSSLNLVFQEKSSQELEGIIYVLKRMLFEIRGDIL